MRKHFSIIRYWMLAGLAVTLSAETESIIDLDQAPSKGATQIWTPLFQASWEKLNTTQEGALEKVEPHNDLIATLEAFQWKEKEVLPEDAYATYAGDATEEFIRETKDAVKEKFDVEIDPRLLEAIPGGKLSYGILNRDLKFKRKFYRSKVRPLQFKSRTGDVKSVEFFGTKGNLSDNFDDHVKVLHYAPDASSFILSIDTDRDGEHLIIYRPGETSNFRDAIKRVNQGITTPLSGPYGSVKNGTLHRDDLVIIPYLTIDSITDFSNQLGGLLYYKETPMPYRIVKAAQAVKFELHEEGARVKVENTIGTEPFSSPPAPPKVTPRRFVCDQPFYVFLWREGSDWPYFSVWVDSFDCLTVFPEK